jgi:hypothetical protein
MRAALAAAALLLSPTLLACVPRDDDYLLLRRTNADQPARLELAAPNDAEANYARQLLADGFGAELLRTYAMVKRFAGRDTPTMIALGTPDASDGARARKVQRKVQIGWWRTTIAPDAPLIWLDDSPGRRDRSAIADLVSGLGGAIVDVVVPETGSAHSESAALRAGYVAFLQAVAAEWRPPRVIDDRDELRRLGVVAHVRANDGVLAPADGVTWVTRDGPSLRARPAPELVHDPVVVATVLYRLAISDLGRQMADPAVYRPFLEAQPPRDVHPALLLGAFRNFQAKLLAAWSRAAAADRPPHDVVDLVEAYAAAYPAERATATRIFLVTTYGATALRDGVRPDAPWERIESELAMLTADVLFGRRGLRDGFGRR